MAMWLVDRFKGGVCTGGWSPTCDGGGSGTFVISIPAGCTIRKAYLLGGQNGTNGLPLVVNLNSNNYTFDNSTRIGSFNGNTPPNILSWIHAIDITAFISPTVNNYTLTLPATNQNIISSRMSDFMLLVEFENPAMDICNVCVFLNDQSQITSFNHTYNLSFPIPISTAADVALGLFVNYICNDTTTGNGSHDAENIEVNNTLLGHIGSTTGNGSCSGVGYKPPRGNFEYHNGVLTALTDCNANLAMSAQDALSNIVSLLSNNATAFSLETNAEESGNYSNAMWCAVVAYKDNIPPPFPYECEAPELSMSLITSTTARVTWIPAAPCGGVNADYNVQHRVVGSPTWIVAPVSMVTQYDFVGLTPATTFEVQVVPTACGAPPAVCAPSNIIDFSTPL